jgi:hypothetical protein
VFAVPQFALPPSPGVMAAISASIAAVEDQGSYTLYVVTLEHNGRSWQVKKRYSEFHTLFQSIAGECTGGWLRLVQPYLPGRVVV